MAPCVILERLKLRRPQNTPRRARFGNPNIFFFEASPEARLALPPSPRPRRGKPDPRINKDDARAGVGNPVTPPAKTEQCVRLREGA
jgi:hypothetical protein